jgi:hypothetical protein
MERADGKAAGDERLYTCQRIGQADGERAPTPHQTRRAVRVVTEPLHQMWQFTRTQIANDFQPQFPLPQGGCSTFSNRKPKFPLDRGSPSIPLVDCG